MDVYISMEYDCEQSRRIYTVFQVLNALLC